MSRILAHQKTMRACKLCPDMLGPVVVGQPVISPVVLLGQAPGAREGPAGRPFAWTAGRTLFSWFARIGLAEEDFRRRVYMAAVCRCFPGKLPGGADRVPSPREIANCSRWLHAELALLRPALVIPVGKLAIAQFIAVGKLDQVVGASHRVVLQGRATEVVPLPHPSGASTWHRREPGLTLLERGLGIISRHPAWQELIGISAMGSAESPIDRGDRVI